MFTGLLVCYEVLICVVFSGHFYFKLFIYLPFFNIFEINIEISHTKFVALAN